MTVFQNNYGLCVENGSNQIKIGILENVLATVMKDK